ncbi:PREDICTED: uncharacterized protein LOC108563724 [Nicrophorus vespilloides]|uniref:Uncharacterized protein LOC108563724 n=1 Tax=Nicrophorus vespilloides TaxID=110193 RepID=A0ABM1MTS2_NICVS|nr:PREDICTED: uncharacterized protein LOC108563724 [Nicrophorus vespilloides]
MERKKDVSKMAFVLPKVLLNILQLWPKEESRNTPIAFFVKLALLIFLELGQVIYFVMNIYDITTISSTLSTISTTFQVKMTIIICRLNDNHKTLQSIIKINIIYVHSARLKVIIVMALNEFWPSDFMGPVLEKSLKMTSMFVIFNMISLMGSASIFAFGFLSKPLLEGSNTLPFLSWYPFEYQYSPVYEILYILQVFTNIYVVILSILGHDFIFLALCINVITQYRLLKMIIGFTGSGNNADLNKSLMELDGSPNDQTGENAETKILIIRCVIHHNKLL